METIVIIGPLLLAIGFVLVGIEMLVPGFGAPGISGFICLVIGIVLTSKDIEGLSIEQLGDRIKHIKFGTGTVLELNKGQRDYEVKVDFDGPGIKNMLAGFAKLEKI